MVCTCHLFESRFGQLTPVCLTSVLSNLSLSELLSCGRVNRHWRTEVAAFCRINVHSIQIKSPIRRPYCIQPSEARHAHLLTNEDGSRMFPPDSPEERYSLTSIDSGFPLSLDNSTLTLFCPHLIKLDVHLVLLNEAMIFGFESLLFQCHSLVSFALTTYSVHFPIGIRQERLHRLFSSINSLRQLSTLTLAFIHERLDIEPDLECLAWLRELYFESIDKRDILRRSLYSYAAKNANLRRITYLTDQISPSNGGSLATMFRYADSVPGRQVARRFTRYGFDSKLDATLSLPQLAALLPLLTCLNLTILVSGWHTTMRHLARLSCLIHLILTAADPPNDAASVDACPRLPSVRTLEFNTTEISMDHTKLSLYHLPHFFPRLQVLVIHDAHYDGLHNLCDICCQAVKTYLRIRGDRYSNSVYNRKAWEAATIGCCRAAISDWMSSETLKYASINDRDVDLGTDI